MASAHRATKVEQVVTEKEVERIHLKLTPQEAKTLEMLSWRIGGASRTTRRGHTQAIRDALGEAGVFSTQAERSRAMGLGRDLYFATEDGIDG